MVAQALSVSEAKARLSNVIAEVEEGARFTILKHGHPVAKIVPFSEPKTDTLRGALAAYANPDFEHQEADAFPQAMEDKHAANN